MARRATRSAAAVAAGAGLALVSALGGVIGSPSGANASPTTITPQVEAGQRQPTQGPVGRNPGVQKRVPLDLIGGLIEGRPILPGDFADPFALVQSSGLYLYATNTVTANIPVMQIPTGDIFNGDYLGDALPTLPAWTVKGFQWAPAVWARPDGTFVMYYATPAPASDGLPRRQCISRAVADAPAGPFTDDSSAPFICPTDQGGAIDPSVFVDQGRPYLLWKADGDCCGLPTPIYSQPLSADGLTTAGPAVPLITDDQAWENHIVEGPSMVRFGSTYELFYSANDWDTSHYSVGIALCSSVQGPCTKPLDHAWMVSAQHYSGPGGQEFFLFDGDVWMVHHGFLPGQAGRPGGQRRLYLDLLQYHGTDPIPTRAGAHRAEVRLLQLGLVVFVPVVLIAAGVTWWVRRRRWRGRAAAT
jgi:beta-xylosidase